MRLHANAVICAFEYRLKELLKSIERVDQLQDLAAQKLNKVVAISARVGSETPITSERGGLRCVIVKETVCYRFQLRHSYPDDYYFSTQPKSKEVPWYLDDGSGRVHVVGATGATDLAISLGSEVFEEPLIDHSGSKGIEKLTITRTEHVLKTGTLLTVVGKVVKNRNDTPDSAFPGCPILCFP